MRNSITDAYFNALKVAARGTPFAASAMVPKECQSCGKPTGQTRLSDGVTSWCGPACRDAAAKKNVDEACLRYLIERGWTAERWAAACAARTA